MPAVQTSTSPVARNLYCAFGLNWCGTPPVAGICRPMGECGAVSDCENGDNLWYHPMCAGSPTCENDRCGWQCGLGPSSRYPAGILPWSSCLCQLTPPAPFYRPRFLTLPPAAAEKPAARASLQDPRCSISGHPRSVDKIHILMSATFLCTECGHTDRSRPSRASTLHLIELRAKVVRHVSEGGPERDPLGAAFDSPVAGVPSMACSW